MSNARKLVLEHFWNEIVDWHKECAASEDDLYERFAKLLDEANRVGFVPPKPFMGTHIEELDRDHQGQRGAGS